MQKTSIVIPVHNRRQVTLRCLHNLADTGVLDWAEILVVDDGSTDGTGQAVRDSFPAVTILTGDGNLWWGGAIRLGMSHAMQTQAECIIWLNDDCLPAPGTLRLLASHAIETGGIAAGWANTPSGGRYSAYRKTWRGLKPVVVPGPGSALACAAAAGNCVAFARAVVTAIGLPEADRLPHALLDADYTLAATRRGFRLDLLGSAVCQNDDNLAPASSSWLLSEQSPMQQWKLFLRPRSNSGYRASWRLHWRHWGVWGVALYARGYVRLLIVCLVRAVVPLAWLRAIYAKRSAAYQKHLFHARPKPAELVTTASQTAKK